MESLDLPILVGGSDLGEQVRDAVLAADPVEQSLHWRLGFHDPTFAVLGERVCERVDAAR
jgi:hypothetical protein